MDGLVGVHFQSLSVESLEECFEEVEMILLRSPWFVTCYYGPYPLFRGLTIIRSYGILGIMRRRPPLQSQAGTSKSTQVLYHSLKAARSWDLKAWRQVRGLQFSRAEPDSSQGMNGGTSVQALWRANGFLRTKKDRFQET